VFWGSNISEHYGILWILREIIEILGFGGSMVASLKFKRIDGRAHQEWSLRLNPTRGNLPGPDIVRICGNLPGPDIVRIDRLTAITGL